MNRLTAFLWGCILATLIGLYWADYQEDRWQALCDGLREDLDVAQMRLASRERKCDIQLTPEEAVWLSRALAYEAERGGRIQGRTGTEVLWDGGGR